jgi:serine/threonine-protein kinase RsbW
LRGLGANEESVYDILLAATEACTNVLTHGGRRVRDYAVVTSLGAVGCQVEVADDGVGLALREPGEPDPQQMPVAQLPESGRGLAVMRACVDNVTLDSRPGRGAVVPMRKRISWPSDDSSGPAATIWALHPTIGCRGDPLICTHESLRGVRSWGGSMSGTFSLVRCGHGTKAGGAVGKDEARAPLHGGTHEVVEAHQTGGRGPRCPSGSGRGERCSTARPLGHRLRPDGPGFRGPAVC